MLNWGDMHVSFAGCPVEACNVSFQIGVGLGACLLGVILKKNRHAAGSLHMHVDLLFFKGGMSGPPYLGCSSSKI